MNKGKIYTILGIILIIGAVFLASYNIYKDFAAYQRIQDTLSQFEYDDPSGYEPNMEMPVVEIAGYKYIGEIEIPSEKLRLPVLSRYNKHSDLDIAPARYSGSAYTDDMIIAGHNYRSHFARIGRLHVGDKIIFTDNNSISFEYEVKEIEIIDGNDIEHLMEGEWDLTLFTCTLSRVNRITIRCVKKNDNMQYNNIN